MGEYLGQSEPERVAVVLYGVLLLVIAGLMAWMWRYVLEARDLRHPDVSDEELEGLRRKSMPGVAIFVGAIAVSLLVPTFGVLLYLVASIFLVVPFQTIRRALPRPR
jgi:ABC-type Fe3+ transport system permease subunit